MWTTHDRIRSITYNDKKSQWSPLNRGHLIIESPPPPVYDDNAEQLRRTWNAAQVQILLGDTFIFGRMDDLDIQRRIANLPAGVTFPTIVYLHGCALPRWTGPYSFWYSFGESGYALIAPDSFARSDTPTRCDQNYSRPSARLQELRFALTQIRRLPWVDRHNLFLIGHDEGGKAAGRYKGDAFKAIIVASTSCDIQLPARRASPLLAIGSVGDPWTRGLGPYCDHATDRILVDGSSHGVMVYPQVRRKIQQFILQRTEIPWT